MYQQPTMRFNTQQGVRQTSQFPQQQLQQLQQQQRSKIIQQQQQQQQLKQRLLQQQKQQQLLIPSNATAPDQISSGIHNIDNLLSNTVAPPNVSLQVYLLQSTRYKKDLLKRKISCFLFFIEWY